MTMIAASHGHDVNLAGMRERFAVSMAGSRLTDLMEFARALDLKARAVKVTPEELRFLRTPAILHWGDRHFVVLTKVQGRRIVIHDPAVGIRSISFASLPEFFGGVALELTPEDHFEVQAAKVDVSIRDAWGPINGGVTAVVQVLALSIFVQILALAAPLFLQISVDMATNRTDGDILLPLTLAFVGVFIITACTDSLRSWTLLFYSNSLNFQMLKRLFGRLLRLPPAYFETRHVGDILSRMSSARAIQNTVTEGLTSGILDIGLGLILLSAIASYSFPAFLVVVSTTLLLGVLNMASSARMRRVQEEAISASAAEQSHMMESIRAASVIKLFAKELDRVISWENRYTNVINSNIKFGQMGISLKFAQDIILSAQTASVIFVGVKSAQAGNISIGMLAALVAYRQMFAMHLSGFLNQLVQFRLIGVHLGRLSDIILSKTDATTIWQTDRSDGLVDHRIELDGLTFRYGAGEPEVLKGADLCIPSGRFVAIIGASGAGKSTIIRLILGLLQPSAGSIRVGGRVLNGSVVRQWRSDVAAVMQNDRLFTGSIGANISFFDPKAELADIRVAAVAADIDQHIMSLPMAYRTPVGDMGSTLSAGQYQRVLLARALYRKPKVLILDEGTANLDPESERKVVDVVGAITATRIVVAHRPALIDAAEEVYRLEGGRLNRLR
jgi:ATP-binding cassette subfamily B protein RaxB